MQHLNKNTTANSGFARLRNMWLIHIYLSQEILSYPKNLGSEVRNLAKPQHVTCYVKKTERIN